MQMQRQGEVKWTQGQELERGTHSKSTRTMTQKYNKKATCNRRGVYNRRANEKVVDLGGGQAIMARYRRPDGYGLRFESRSKKDSLQRVSKRSETRAGWRNEWGA